MVHLQNKGFQIKTVDMSYAELAEIKKQHGVPAQLNSCHTGLVGGYVIEGHVPGDILLRFLKEKPNVAGIGVPGMPVGSPGMPGPLQPYDVFTFDRKGQLKVYARIDRPEQNQ